MLYFVLKSCLTSEIWIAGLDGHVVPKSRLADWKRRKRSVGLAYPGKCSLCTPTAISKGIASEQTE